MSADRIPGAILTLRVCAVLVTCLFSLSASSNETDGYVGYGVLIDGGSSSSKLKIYGWKPPKPIKQVPTIALVFNKSYKPGIQTYYSKWDNLTLYIQDILNDAMGYVPKQMHSDTPIYVMATAGVRSLSMKETTILLDQIRERLARSVFSYHPDRVDVLSGEEEGVYSWIAANYLLGFFDSNKPRNKSVGILEMGGASMQITFIPRDPVYAEEFQVTIAGTKYQLYAQSYMKYGGTAIKERIADALASKNSGNLTLNNPCMLKDDSSMITLESGIKYTMMGTGSALQCLDLLEGILQPNQGYGCQPKPCAIGSVHQPSVDNISFYAIQAFTHTPKTLKAIDKDNILHLELLQTAAITYCNQSIKDVDKKNKKYASDDCLMGLFIPTLFTKSYGFSNTSTNIKSTSNVGSQTIDWSLGVMLMELSSRFTFNTSAQDYFVTCPTREPGDASHGYIKDNNSVGASYPSLVVVFICYLLCAIANLSRCSR